MSDQDVVVEYTRDQFEAAFPGSTDVWDRDINNPPASNDPDYIEEYDAEAFFTVNDEPHATITGNYFKWVDGEWVNLDD